ncbi:hypothetical protein CPB84DRAFT_1795176 [Gymnopilus junonius]|uniref:F-box domain-containing protein n=1 Tax=Gymnopilus junonius TaxID=109634 RepID=A0A9P5NB92_GYMJU|nr:hypothetical protein CPB84DRAFT_1795176 [Gymnopilus junonius]
MLSPVDQEESSYYYLDQEVMPTSLWYSDWQGYSYNTVQDPEKTPTTRPTDLSQQAFHFQDSLTLQQAESLSESYLNYDPDPVLNTAFDPDPALFVDFEQSLDTQSFIPDMSMLVNTYADSNLHFESDATQDLKYASTDNEGHMQGTHERHSDDGFPSSIPTATSTATHPFPTFDEIFKTDFVKRIFHLDRLPKDWVAPSRHTKPFVLAVSKANMVDHRVALDFLSKEICVRICDYLNPNEITKLGMAIKSLYRQIVQDRNVWYRALRRLTKLNSVPLSFYPMSMGMGAFSMRIMADWPSRWLYGLRTHPSGGHPYERRAFDCRGPGRNSSTEPNYKGLSILLVPSGRYLIADDGRQLFFWDMLMGAQLPFEFGCSYVHEHPSGARPAKPILEAFQSPGGNIRVISFFERTKDKIGRYIIYDVCPRNYFSPSTITPICNGAEHDKGGLYACNGDLLAILVGRILSVRNIITQSMERLAIHNPENSPAKLLMFSGPCSIILVHLRGLSVYNFSLDLRDSSQKHHIPSKTLQPIFSVPIEFHDRMNKDLKIQGSRSYTPPVFESPPLWHQNSDVHPLVFDIVRNRKGKESHQVRWRYEISFPGPVTGDNAQGISSLAPSCTCINRIMVPNQWTNIRNFGFCKDQIILAGSLPGVGVGVTYAPDHLPLQDGRLGINRGVHSSYLFGTEVPDLPQTSDLYLCPVTGRVCYTTRKPYEIAVIDYFYV